MRSIFIALLAVISPWLANAQFDTPSVPNSVGFELPMENSSFTISIGEPAITTLISTSSVITQGYLQPIDRSPCTDISFVYYPNPATDYLVVKPIGCDDRIQSIEIIDLWGRTLNLIQPQEDNRIFLGDLSQGLYVFKVLLKGGTSGNFTAVKTIN